MQFPEGYMIGDLADHFHVKNFRVNAMALYLISV